MSRTVPKGYIHSLCSLFSPVKALGIGAVSYYDSETFKGIGIDIDIPQKGKYPFYIPELDKFVTSFPGYIGQRGNWQILDKDVEGVLKTAFDLPANMQKLVDPAVINSDQRVWSGTTDDGRLLFAYVNGYDSRVGIFLRP